MAEIIMAKQARKITTKIRKLDNSDADHLKIHKSILSSLLSQFKKVNKGTTKLCLIRIGETIRMFAESEETQLDYFKINDFLMILTTNETILDLIDIYNRYKPNNAKRITGEHLKQFWIGFIVRKLRRLGYKADFICENNQKIIRISW